LPDAPRLIFLSVGINNYKAAKRAPGKGVLGDLEEAVNDAKELPTAWASQKLFGAKVLMPPLTDMDATRPAILAGLKDLAQIARPDDICVVFLSGHGDYQEEKPTLAGGPPRSVFVFCPPDYDPNNPYKTGVTNEELFDKLAAIPCRKLLILDACHSGAAADNPARDFAPDGQGPIVMAACDLNQSSLEDKKFGHGLFTRAILDALDDAQSYPDHDGAKELWATDLFRHTRKEMPALLKLIDKRESAQVPILFAPGNQDFPVARQETPKKP
jgi:uncharacterized caspase-like protein